MVQYAFGRNAMRLFQIVIALLCFSFSFPSLVFFTKILHSFFKLASGEDYNIYYFMIVTICILGPLAWIRTIETFRIGFVISGLGILFMVITMTVLVSIIIKE